MAPFILCRDGFVFRFYLRIVSVFSEDGLDSGCDFLFLRFLFRFSLIFVSVLSIIYEWACDFVAPYRESGKAGHVVMRLALSDSARKSWKAHVCRLVAGCIGMRKGGCVACG